MLSTIPTLSVYLITQTYERAFRTEEEALNESQGIDKKA